MKKLKVKDLAETYKVSTDEVIAELTRQGITVKAASSQIPEDMVELVEAYFDDLYHGEDAPVVKNDERPRNKSKNRGKEEFERSGKSGGKPGKNKDHRNSESSSNGNAGAVVDGVARLSAPFIVKNVAEAIGKKPNEVISELMKLGELLSINQPISENTLRKLLKNFALELEIVKAEPVKTALEADNDYEMPAPADDPEKWPERPPVVTFMGHVDHGKTSLQDRVRNTHVVEGESGRITQHIGASTVVFNGKPITFIDTPGHAAFTSMRARGANVTDIVVLVVAADDGFMPQTVEAMNHALAAKVPLIVAINKIDLPDANPDKIYLHMQQNNLTCEDWGGTVGVVKVSAKTGAGIDDLLERILLEAEMLDLKAQPKRPAVGTVIEAQVENGLGPTASILVQNGTLSVGDIVLAGEEFGRVKTLINDRGERIKSAGPSTPVKLVGLSGVPEAADNLVVCTNEKLARQEAEKRRAASRALHLANQTISSAEDLFSKLNEQEHKSLRLIIKSDVRGSGEAIEESLKQLPSEKIGVEVVMNGVGAITENDITLAAASDAIVVGFHVRVNPGVNDLAEKSKVEIRLYSIIYELLEDITDALTGRLEPEKREKELGKARILQIFELNKGPKVCGCLVEDGLVKVGSKARVFRNNQLIYNGEVASLRRFQDDVKEVRAGLECGIRLDNFVDFIEGDVIDLYEIELKKATL